MQWLVDKDNMSTVFFFFFICERGTYELLDFIEVWGNIIALLM